MNPLIKLTNDILDPRSIEALISAPEYGALITFSGRVRNHHQGESVFELHYEAYDEMVLKSFDEILQAAQSEFPGTTSAIHHRIGTLAIGDIAVLVCTGSAHRDIAYKANSWIIKEIKKRSPIFKHETRKDGKVWVNDHT